MYISILRKDERRTGAGMFVHSGTVGNDPLILVEFQTGGIRFDVCQRDQYGTGNVTRLERRGTAHIHKDSSSTVERGFRLLEGDARDLRLAGRRPGGRWGDRRRLRS